MQRTTADHAAMHQAALRVEGVQQNLTQLLNGLMNRLSPLASEWTGAGGRSFQQVQDTWRRDVTALIGALGDIATGVRQAGGNYAGTDSGAGDRLTQISARVGRVTDGLAGKG